MAKRMKVERPREIKAPMYKPKRESTNHAAPASPSRKAAGPNHLPALRSTRSRPSTSRFNSSLTELYDERFASRSSFMRSSKAVRLTGPRESTRFATSKTLHSKACREPTSPEG
jgi:hypothetical protein